jgi:hypothetical protein
MHTLSYPPGKRRFARRVRPQCLAWMGGLLLATAARAVSPPAISLAYTTPGNAPVQGAVSLGNNGLYLTTLGTAGHTPKAIALNSSHTVLWTKDLGAGAKVLAPPSVSPDGTKLYLAPTTTSSSAWTPATASSGSPATWFPTAATARCVALRP